MPLVVAMTGASGAIYGIELLKTLNDLGQPPYLVVSRAGWRSLQLETSYLPAQLKEMALACYAEEDIAAPLASGSFAHQGMIVAPCSIKSLSAIAHSFNHNLIIRAADCCLKERRPLVLMVRESPLHRGHLELMSKAAALGAVILPPMPAFYHKPQSVEDIVRHSVGKALDQFAIAHNLYSAWQGADFQ